MPHPIAGAPQGVDPGDRDVLGAFNAANRPVQAKNKRGDDQTSA
jgi:hypothetical protein